MRDLLSLIFTYIADEISSAVGRIRRKLNNLSPGAGKRYIKTKTGFGYMLTIEDRD